MDVTVCIGTYGGQEWHDLAHQRAIPSVRGQCRYVHAHQATLAEARNAALAMVATEWVIHLDADDELAEGYVEAMATGTADLRAPSVCYLRNGRERRFGIPRVYGHTHDCTGECLPEGNWIVIGAAVRTELLRRVGGWQAEEMYEDWSAWLRCWLAGATVEAIPQAVYRAHIRADSRNRAPSRAQKEHWHRVIYESCFAEAA